MLYSTNTTDSTNTTTSGSGSSAPSTPTGATSANDGTQSSHKSNSGAIAGGVVGGVVLLAVLLLGWLWYRRRSNKPHAITPYHEDARSEDKGVDVGHARGQRYVAPLAFDSSREEVSQSSRPQSSQASDDSLRQNIQTLRDQLKALRAERGMRASATPPSQYSSTNDSQKASPLAFEIQSLREEIEQLRTQQTSVTSPTSPATTDLMMEISFLRAEMDEMRMQQDIIQGPLPSYSPPARPLPGVPITGFTA